jgi:Dna[CI] antecedent DciA-like protein
VSGPQRLGTILDRWRPNRDMPIADPASSIAAAWAESVGPDVARRTRPGRLRDGVLTVYTAGSTWSHQLTFLAPTILAALIDCCPDSGVRHLRFVVASGRTKALLDGLAVARAGVARQAKAPLISDSDASLADADSAGVDAIIRHLQLRQQSLDRRREREGWTRCEVCSAWRRPVDAPEAACAVCAHEARRAADNRIERVLANAPWLRSGDMRSYAPGVDDRAFSRVRRRLMARWEEHLFAARRRLRRGELQAGDRVIAWSYLMLRSNLHQHEIGRAVVTDVLGEQWAQALAGSTAPRPTEASATVREKQRNTNSRVFRRAP